MGYKRRFIVKEIEGIGQVMIKVPSFSFRLKAMEINADGKSEELKRTLQGIEAVLDCACDPDTGKPMFTMEQITGDMDPTVFAALLTAVGELIAAPKEDAEKNSESARNSSSPST